MGGVRYSLAEGANVLGVTEKTLKARLNRAGITPTVDPTDRRRLLVTEADIKSVSRLDRVDVVTTPNTPLGKCVQNVRNLLIWQKRTDSSLREYGDTVEAISRRVQQIEALTTLTLKKVESIPASEDTQTVLRDFISGVAASVAECRDIEQRLQAQVASFESDRNETVELRNEIESGLHVMKRDICSLTERVAELQALVIDMNSSKRMLAGDRVMP